jgi:ABC-type dipeptide/oligopeptide/nickel transport system permease subunit
LLDPRAGSRFRKNRAAIVGAGIVIALVAFAAVGPLVATHDPFASDFARGITPSHTPVGPGHEFVLGTDRIFRDELARLAYGARMSLVIGIAATSIASVIGAIVGIVAGYYEGSEGVPLPWIVLIALFFGLILVINGHPWWAAAIAVASAIACALAARTERKRLLAGPRINPDIALMRSVDIGLSFPFLLLVMAIGAALERTTVLTILAILGFTGWLGTARIIRAKTIQIRALDFIVAARALGQSTPRILARHVLPNVAGTLIVVATISVAQMILAESVLGYLGVGISPPTPTWGHMLYEGQDYYLVAPWLVLAPGVAIVLAVLGFNLLGEGLRDALDPHED